MFLVAVTDVSGGHSNGSCYPNHFFVRRTVVGAIREI